ncbi:MAG: hypothetical protein NT040_16675 [Bacteroidetes bacterium]|nr:hypothetical protein [Bacteroidota bacterium]
MNPLDFSDLAVRKQNTEYFVQLVRIAMADDVVNNQELELLCRTGRKLGFTDDETARIIETTGKSDYAAPLGLSERFDQLYGAVKMTLADGAIDKNEMRLASGFAMKSGFTENEIPKLLLLLIDGNKHGKDGKELFESYSKK